MFRVQSTLEYPTDPVEERDFMPEDYEIDLSNQYLARSLIKAHGSPFPNSSPVSGESDPKYLFTEVAERFLIVAKLASENAQSYRNFNVGALLFAEKEPGYFGVFYGANVNLFPDDPKICAEQVALEKATRKGFKKVVGVAVFGPTQEDHGSGLSLPVLHPCEACRERFDRSPLADGNMLITTANPDGQYEFTNLETVLALHEKKVDPNTINTHRVQPEAAQAVIRLSLLGGWIPESDSAP